MAVYAGEMVEINAKEFQINFMDVIAPRIKLLGVTFTVTTLQNQQPVLDFLKSKGIHVNLMQDEDKLVHLAGVTGNSSLLKTELDAFLATQKIPTDLKDDVDIKQSLEAKKFKERFTIRFSNIATLENMGFYEIKTVKFIDPKVSANLGIWPERFYSASNIELEPENIDGNKETIIGIKNTNIISGKNICTKQKANNFALISEPQEPVLDRCLGHLTECWTSGKIEFESINLTLIRNSMLQTPKKITLNSDERVSLILNPMHKNCPIFWLNLVPNSLHAYTKKPITFGISVNPNPSAAANLAPENPAAAAAAAGAGAAANSTVLQKPFGSVPPPQPVILSAAGGAAGSAYGAAAAKPDSSKKDKEKEKAAAAKETAGGSSSTCCCQSSKY